ncbi:MAG: FliH/SctL family protein [Pseudomonadota bacterium]
MKGQPTIKKNMQVLRDVLVHNHVHTLHRPGKAVEKNFAVKNKVESDIRPLDSKPAPLNFGLPATPNKLPLVDRYEEGYLAGKIEGHALAVREVEQKLQAELDVKREQLFQEAYKLGQQQGFANGQKEGLTLAQNDAAELKENLHQHLAQFEQILASLPVQLDNYMRDAEDELVTLSFAAVTKILGESLSSETAIRELINSLVKQHLTDTEFAVHLHPDDYAVMVAANSSPHQFRWVSDANIKLGGLIIRSSEQSLDARLDFQIEVLKQGLLQARNLRKNKLRYEHAQTRVVGATASDQTGTTGAA